MTPLSTPVLSALWEKFRTAKLAALEQPTERNRAVAWAHARAFTAAANGEVTVQ
jgi:hypothetical protein